LSDTRLSISNEQNICLC